MKTLELTFTMSSGGTMRIIIPNPKLPVDSVEVARVMDLIVDKQMFVTKAGHVVGKKAARLLDQTVSSIVV
ncbi:DUF2922 domain-containing protein [Aneurinibacillus thermoaerophilus]|uniref:DUF2922 domain-containing protein n=1 Tax=Aneurinibacillus thermoaerophilus TaxID=143495 RepID=A0ABX8YDM0_ANETH|nr:DUF2922 domain-containing protein [Aneurinibacillus thermoaerophilus]QYY43722.1 DUF2922 domain-containing protein [Aneurinibacillus thermoaerophilus]